MSTVSITPNDKYTQINVFTLHDPANQQELVDIMSSVISGPGRSVPGFIATALHRSVDGTKVVVYSQWSTKDAAKALGEMEEMKPYMKQAFEIAAFAPTVCEVVALLRELQALKTVLVKLDDLTHNSHSWQTGSSTDAAALSLLDIESCTAEIEEIQQKFGSRLDARGKMKVVHHLIWPFIEDKTMQMVKTLHSYVDIFHLALSMDNFAINKATLVEIQNLRSEIKLDAKQKSILHWLSPESQTAVHEWISSQRHEATGKWFLENVTRTGWPFGADSARVLWCRGIPGAGKTVLTSLTIDHTASVNPECAVIYYYLSYKHEGSQDIETIISSLVSQLLVKVPALWPSVDILYKKCETTRRKPSIEDAVSLLFDLENPSKVIIAIDALDEASNSTRDALLKLLSKLCDLGFRAFVTSRLNINPRQLQAFVMVIDITAQKQDLEIYASARLRENENVQEVLGSLASTVVIQMINFMISQAAGMFLLVVFQTDFICNQTTVREMLEAAKKMPSDPNSIYSRTLDQINSQSQSQARLANRVLTWLTFAGETLTSQELVEALAIEDQSSELDPLNKPSASMLTRACRGLVIVSESNGIIQLAHRTLQDYLTSLYSKKAGVIHNTIYSACLTYLSFDVFRTGPCATPAEFRHRRNSHAFQQYAAEHLGYHFFWSSGREKLLGRMYQFITCKPLVQSYAQAQNYSSRLLLNTTSHFFAKGTTELHVAATIEDSELLELVLTRSPHLINQVDEAGRTALVMAVERGCEEAVRSLLGAGASMMSESGESLLNCAARNQHNDIVELLLHHQDVNRETNSASQTTPQERQLLIAAMKADQKIVEQVLDSGTNSDARDLDGGTSLQWAAWYGYDEIVTTLLNHGADVNAVDDTSGRRALHEAAEHGNSSTAKILLDRGADVDAKDIWEWTPLHRAATQGGCEVVDLLLCHGANIHMKAAGKKTALDLACEHGQLHTIRLLLGKLGGTLPEDFDARAIKFWRVPMATRIEIHKVLRDHLPQSVEGASAERLIALDILTARMDEGPWTSDPSDLENFYNQGLTITDSSGFLMNSALASAAACIIM